MKKDTIVSADGSCPDIMGYKRCEESHTSQRPDVTMPEYDTNEDDSLDCEPVQLQPFIHQVGGHSCVLRFNETTLCKPLITREHLFYESMPSELKTFIPDYRGIIEVELQEDDDGHMTLIGYPTQSDAQEGGHGGGSHRASPKGFEHGHSPVSSGSENESSNSPLMRSKNKHTRSGDDSYSVRLLRSGSIEVSTETNTLFHSPDPKAGPKSAGLNPWSLKCHKRQLAKMRTDNQDSNMKKFILLENVAARFRYPCILDLKMGTRQHGDDAPEAKKHSQMRKCASTTSSAVGVRLIGMQVYQSNSGQFVCQNKYYGRKLTVEGFKEALEQFIYNGDKMRLELLEPILTRLRQLYKVIQRQDSFRFYSSSLLIMYGGNNNTDSNDCDDRLSNGLTGSEDVSRGGVDDDTGEVRMDPECDICSGTFAEAAPPHTATPHDNQCPVDIRMIDFAHSTHKGFRDDERHKGVDQGYLFGIQNLIRMFEDIQKRFCQSFAK